MRLDVFHAPQLDFATVLAARAVMKEGAAAGTDEVVNEVWKGVPFLVLVAIWEMFRTRLMNSSGPVNTHWRTIGLVGIQKMASPSALDHFRFIAQNSYFAEVVSSMLDVFDYEVSSNSTRASIRLQEG